MEPDVRDDIVHYVEWICHRAEYSRQELIGMIGIYPSRYYEWRNRPGLFNRHNGRIPKSHWILDEERRAIESYCADKEKQGVPENLPSRIDEGDVLALLELIIKQHFTKLPPRYSESSLVKLLDKLGIGRPVLVQRESDILG